MTTQDSSIFKKDISPLKQAGIVFGLSAGIMLLTKLAQLASSGETDKTVYWTIAATFILFFAIFNALFSLSTKNMDKYWTQSILSYASLVVLTGLLAYLMSSISIDDAGSYRWIYIVLTMGYLIFLSMMTVMRKIVEFAQKEEWNHPRLRKKGRKHK